MTTSIKAKLWNGRTNKQCIGIIKSVSKFVSKLIKYSILFRDILTCLGHDYRNALLITSYLVAIGISIIIG